MEVGGHMPAFLLICNVGAVYEGSTTEVRVVTVTVLSLIRKVNSSP